MKRYLGLKRSKGNHYFGGIEHLLPGQISGWVFGQQGEFHEVRLLVGATLVARDEINLSRPDVCQELGREGTPGFSLRMPREVPELDWSQPTRVIALSADGQLQAELEIPEKTLNTSEELKRLLQCENLGAEGHCDGLIEGNLQGWAAKRGQAKATEIWIQCQGHEPRLVICNELREGMEALGFPSNCGFRLSLKSVPSEWGGCIAWFSFDKGGRFKLPQEKKVVIPRQEGVSNVSVAKTEYVEKTMSAPDSLKDHWKALEDFSFFLDGLEAELDRRDEAKERKQSLTANGVGILRKLARSIHPR